MSSVHAVIMAGGSGTRFWPASRTARPKQLLPIAQGVPLIRATLDRLDGFVDAGSTWIVTNAAQAEGIRRVLRNFDDERLIVEPEPRDTAPCIGLAVARVAAVDPDAVIVVLPADHVIEPRAESQRILSRAAGIASDGQTLVTLGISPTRPSVDYGYIEPAEPLDADTPPARRVARFREKPDAATAQRFLEDGRMLWNSGIFVWTQSSLLAAMETGSPELAAATTRMLEAARDDDTPAVLDAFRSAPKTSIDYAVMEHATRVAVVEADLQWNDVGSFLALDAISPTDAAGIVQSLHRGATVSTLDSRDCVVYAEGDRTIALLGAEDLVVVAVDDAVLVCPKSRASELKRLVQQLRDENRSDLL